MKKKLFKIHWSKSLKYKKVFKYLNISIRIGTEQDWLSSIYLHLGPDILGIKVVELGAYWMNNNRG